VSHLPSLLALVGVVAAAPADAPLVVYGEPLPPGAVARFGLPVSNVNATVGAGGSTPTGSLRVAVAAGKDVRIWAWQPAGSRPPVVRLTGHAADIHVVAMSPDGRFVASADRAGEVRIWELATGDSSVLKKPGETVTALAIGARGRRVVVAAGRAVNLYDRGTGQSTHIGTHDRDVITVAFPADATRIATADVKGRVTVWRSDGTRLAELPWEAIPEPKPPPPGPLDKLLKSKGTAPGVIDFDHGVRKISFSPNGKRLAAGGGTVVRVWDVSDKRVVWQHNRHTRIYNDDLRFMAMNAAPPPTGPRQVGRVCDIAFSTDGRYLASSGVHGDVRITDADRGTDVREPPTRPAFAESRAWLDGQIGLTFAPGGRTLTQFNGAGRAVREDVVSGRQIALAGGHGRGVGGLAITPDGRCLATFSDDERIRLWRLSTGECLSETVAMGTSFGGQRGMAFSPDGQWFVTGGTYHGFYIFGVVGDPPRLTMKDKYDTYPFSGHAFLPGHAARLYGTLRSYSPSRSLDLGDRKEHGPGFVPPNDVRDLSVSLDGKRVAVAYGYSSSPLPDLMEVATGKQAVALAGPSRLPLGVDMVEFSPDGRLLVGLGRAGVTLWDEVTGRVYRHLAAPTDIGWWSFAIAGNGRVLAVGGAGYIRLFEVATGRVLHEWTDIPGAHSLRFLKTGLLLSGGADGAIYLWDARPHLVRAASVPTNLDR
jgi:WD40 repeat protein